MASVWRVWRVFDVPAGGATIWLASARPRAALFVSSPEPAAFPIAAERFRVAADSIASPAVASGPIASSHPTALDRGPNALPSPLRSSNSSSTLPSAAAAILCVSSSSGNQPHASFASRKHVVDALERRRPVPSPVLCSRLCCWYGVDATFGVRTNYYRWCCWR